MQIKKNDVYTIEITDTGTQGEGIGRADGCALFVKDALIGDVVQVKIMKVKKTYAYAKLEKVLSPSPFAGSAGDVSSKPFPMSSSFVLKKEKLEIISSVSGGWNRPLWMRPGNRLSGWKSRGVTGIRPSFLSAHPRTAG